MILVWGFGEVAHLRDIDPSRAPIVLYHCLSTLSIKRKSRTETYTGAEVCEPTDLEVAIRAGVWAIFRYYETVRT